MGKAESSGSSATTRLAAVIGKPIRHSLSPKLLNAAFQFMKCDWTYVAFEVDEASLGRAMEGVRGLGIGGLSVTMPHKVAVMEYLDFVSERARRLRSVNVVYWREGLLCGDSTDGEALVESLQSQAGVDIRAKSIALLGTGGAARAIALALGDSGATSVQVIGRNRESVASVIELVGSSGVEGSLDGIHESDVVINATSVGMKGTSGQGQSPLPDGVLRVGQVVYDIVYNPLLTPLLAQASLVGVPGYNGLGMLVHQAAEAFSIWTGQDAPLGVMFDVANGVLIN